jgi:hypothetical protein
VIQGSPRRPPQLLAALPETLRIRQEMTRRYFDLNIQRVLEHWTVAEALREIIANALDEAALSESAEPQIFEADHAWHVRDFGRGLRYEHFTQNEDDEKLARSELVIGKFGVGLKDAMATFDRNGVSVTIQSKHCYITIESVAKHGFDDVLTLHAAVEESTNPQMVGTEFVFRGLKGSDVDRAKDFFLIYSGDEVLEGTGYGQVLRRRGESARIYVSGLRVAEEPNFLFSYNITSLTKALRSALNRERSNVGRQAYSDRVKAILLECSSAAVAGDLANDFAQFASGTNHDESGWIDVGLHACKVLNSLEQVVFVTPAQLHTASGLIGRAERDGHRIVVVPESVALKLPSLRDVEGNAMRDLDEYREEWNSSFEYSFVDLDELTPAERNVFDLMTAVFESLEPEVRRVRAVRISETMRIGAFDGNEVEGTWEDLSRQIVIKRVILGSRERFLSVLLHEVAHAYSGADDGTDEFEAALTHLLGRVGALAF